jgi:quercetin dioxygenase-like cupin family protein
MAEVLGGGKNPNWHRRNWSGPGWAGGAYRTRWIGDSYSRSVGRWILRYLTESKEVMKALAKPKAFTSKVVERECETLEVFGPSVQFLIGPQPGDESPCVMKGTIPPNVCVPMHSHPGIEAFYMLSGEVEVLTEEGEAHWIKAGPGDFIEVPGEAKHGFRNRSKDPVVQLITTTSRLGRFFQEVGRSLTREERVSSPSPDEIQHFLKTAERYGYWLATPEENAAVGISLFQF